MKGIENMKFIPSNENRIEDRMINIIDRKSLSIEAKMILHTIYNCPNELQEAFNKTTGKYCKKTALQIIRRKLGRTITRQGLQDVQAIRS